MFQDWLVYLIMCFWIIAPLGLANMAPTFFKNNFKFLAKRIDFGKEFKNQPLFGKTKTIRGIIAAVIFGEIAFLLIQWFCTFEGFREYVFINYLDLPIWLGFLLGFGAIIGDLLESFIKRRFNKESSSKWFPWDNIDYLIGGFVVWIFFINLTWYDYFAVLILGLILHLLFNLLGYALKIKKHPW